MPKPKPSAAPPRADEPHRVEVEAMKRFRHDGADVSPGVVLQMLPAEAAELIALGFGRLRDTSA